MGGFEDGERYRGQQTQFPLEDPDQPEVKIPVMEKGDKHVRRTKTQKPK
jgi:hypothetical protein